MHKYTASVNNNQAIVSQSMTMRKQIFPSPHKAPHHIGLLVSQISYYMQSSLF